MEKKYAHPTPRYTSFPAYPDWNRKIKSRKQWYQLFNSSLADEGNEVNVYIHIPYCKKLCFYCGCSRFISQSNSEADDYIDFILREWDEYKQQLKPFKIKTLYLGGGTPTFLSPETLDRLLSIILSGKSTENTSKHIEIDPRVTTREHIRVLGKHQFNRVSMGVQDLSDETQKAINRVQPFEMVQLLNRWCREENINEVNFDIIHGLPLQSKESIQETIHEIGSLEPDSLSFYEYAHFPSKNKQQKVLERYRLPNKIEKNQLFEHGKKELEKLNYQQIGIDFFVKKRSRYYKAFLENLITRNFMGYDICGADSTIGIGASSISNCPDAFFHNFKDIALYKSSLFQKTLGPFNSHQMSKQDKLIAKSIKELMCYGETQVSQRDSFQDLIHDGYATYDKGILKVDKRNNKILRVACSRIDPYFVKSV